MGFGVETARKGAPCPGHEFQIVTGRQGFEGALDLGDLGSAIDYAAHMVLMCIIALVLAVVAYLRYDVR